MLTGSVQASDRYIETGSAMRAPNGNATVGRRRRDEGVEALLPQPVEVALDQRADLLRLEVERVVVAGRQRVGAEHDPALDLRPEALAAGREVVGEVVVATADAVAEPDAVVAGEVGRRLGRRDDVVRGEAVVGVREADLLDGRAGRLERGDRLADPRLHAGLHARRRSTPSAARTAGRAATRPPRRRTPGRRMQVVRGRPPARRSSRARRGRRSRGAAPRRRARRGRTARSGRGCSRTPRSRSG